MTIFALSLTLSVGFYLAVLVLASSRSIEVEEVIEEERVLTVEEQAALIWADLGGA